MSCSRRTEERVGSTGTGGTGSCKLPNRCWELNSGFEEGQHQLLTPEPSSHPPIFLITPQSYILLLGVNAGSISCPCRLVIWALLKVLHDGLYGVSSSVATLAQVVHYLTA